MASIRNGYLCLYRKHEFREYGIAWVEESPELWYQFDSISETKQGFTIYRNGKKPTFVPKWFGNYEYKIRFSI